MKCVMLVGMWLVDMDWKTEIFKRVDALAEKLGVAAGHLWAVLVRQAFAEAAASLSMCLICVIVLAIVARYLPGWWRAAEEDNWISGDKIFRVVASCIVSIPAIVLFCVNIYNAALLLVNPEYFALQKVLELFK